MLKGILLDYGGTIDTNGLHWAVVMYDVYQKNNVPISKTAFEQAFSHGERTLAMQKFIYPQHDFLDTLKIKTGIQFQFLVKHNHLKESDYGHVIDAITNDCNSFALQTIEKAKPILSELQKHYKIILVSNFYGNIQTVLEKFDLKKYFVDVVESAIVGIRKPDAAIFSYAADALQLPPQNCVVIGDSYSKDIVPGKNAGCKTIWLKGKGWGLDSDEIDSADAIIESFSDIPGAVDPMT